MLYIDETKLMRNSSTWPILMPFSKILNRTDCYNLRLLYEMLMLFADCDRHTRTIQLQKSSRHSV